MRKTALFLMAATFMFACTNNSTGEHEAHQHKDTTAKPVSNNAKSLPAEAILEIDKARFRITYHAPAVRGRVIWGGLVPYDSVWVTGAHSATTLEAGSDFMVAGQQLPAGKYAIFTRPGRKEWTVILNTRWDQHLADEYDKEEDAVSFKVQADTTAPMQERLKYEIIQTGERKANIIISWEKVRVPFEISVLK